MKKLAFLLLFLLFSATAEAKIQADQDFNESVAFYCWDDYRYAGGMGAGGVWVTFVKYIDKDDKAAYWLRIDSMRRDKLLQYGTFDVAGASTKIGQVDADGGKYSRVGIRGRAIPSVSLIKAFIDVPADAIDSLTDRSPAAIVLNFQGRSNMKLDISAEKIQELIAMRALKKSDYDKYK